MQPALSPDALAHRRQLEQARRVGQATRRLADLFRPPAPPGRLEPLGARAGAAVDDEDRDDRRHGDDDENDEQPEHHHWVTTSLAWVRAS